MYMENTKMHRAAMYMCGTVLVMVKYVAVSNKIYVSPTQQHNSEHSLPHYIYRFIYSI